MDTNEDQSNNASLSWERSINACSIGSSATSDNNEQLFLFGYSCKLFRDDNKAKEIDSGKHLIPWMNNESLLIDRFDVRGYLNDIKQHEPNKSAYEELTPQELELETLCDAERYADLVDDNNHEEELKRLHLALADGASYHQMDYNYENNSSNANEAAQPLPAKEPEVETKDCFKIPSGLTLPEGITLPDSQKLHNIIEKTAHFVSQHGTQMEIIVKAKQSSNSNFHFLSFDSPLNPYYRVLLSNIKSGKYIPKQTEKTEKSDSDDDSDSDEHYLHPSLLSSGKNQIKPNIPLVIPNLLRFSDTTHDSYSQLVKSLKDKLMDNEIEKHEKPVEPIDKACVSVIEKSDNEEKLVSVTQPTWSSILPSPPPEIEIIIEKLAQHVAKNGDDFELSIRKREETRFEFVNPGNIYHAHYIRRKLHYLEENRKAQAAKIKHLKSLNKTDSHAPKAPVSFSIGLKESTKTGQSSHYDESPVSLSKREAERASSGETTTKRNSNTALKDKLAYAARDRVAREKQLQEERKRKAAVFLSMIKKQSKESKQDNSNDSANASQINNNVVGPELPKSSISNQQLSPTIVAVTSPQNSPELNNKTDEENRLESDYISKSGAILPFIASDKPLKESSSARHSSPHRHHRHHHKYKKSHKSRKRSPSPKEKSKSNSKSRSPSCSRSPSHNKYKRTSKSKSKSKSKSRSRSRSRSHSRSHKKH